MLTGIHQEFARRTIEDVCLARTQQAMKRMECQNGQFGSILEPNRYYHTQYDLVLNSAGMARNQLWRTPQRGSSSLVVLQISTATPQNSSMNSHRILWTSPLREGERVSLYLDAILLPIRCWARPQLSASREFHTSQSSSFSSWSEMFFETDWKMSRSCTENQSATTPTTRTLHSECRPWRYGQSQCAQACVPNVIEIVADELLGSMNFFDSQVFSNSATATSWCCEAVGSTLCIGTSRPRKGGGRFGPRRSFDVTSSTQQFVSPIVWSNSSRKAESKRRIKPPGNNKDGVMARQTWRGRAVNSSFCFLIFPFVFETFLDNVSVIVEILSQRKVVCEGAFTLTGFVKPPGDSNPRVRSPGVLAATDSGSRSRSSSEGAGADANTAVVAEGSFGKEADQLSIGLLRARAFDGFAQLSCQ